jgi:hypothetical protein
LVGHGQAIIQNEGQKSALVGHGQAIIQNEGQKGALVALGAGLGTIDK